jgi:phosphoribosylamine--glycine ligase
LACDPTVAAVHVAPGNPGTWRFNQDHDGLSPDDPLWSRLTDLDPLDSAAVVDLARELGSDLVVIGPEAPLVAGVADDVRAAGLACFGPSAAAAQIEGSKQFAKDVMAAAGVPTAASLYCTTTEQAATALDEFGPPYVVKNDGLAAGKGVVVTNDRAAALAHAIDCGAVVIEEYLDGPEVSLFAISDGTTAVPLLPAQDFKRVGDGGTGLNTGGMGAYAPLPWAPADLVATTMKRVIQPTIKEMTRRGTPFAGLLYAGLALTSRGLRVVEFNARFGDPETQVVLPLLESGLGEVLAAAAAGRLDEIGPLVWRPGAAVVVVMAARGYPGPPLTGGRIEGPRLYGPRPAAPQGTEARPSGSDQPASAAPPGTEARPSAPDQPASAAPQGTEARPSAPDQPDAAGRVDLVHIVHASTALDAAGHLVADGGRVLGVVGEGPDLSQARDLAYDAVHDLDFPTGFCRSDIAQRAAEGLIPRVDHW